ncbi:PREDICTED: protein STICHEL-like 2 [Tarenaya hassleriana]|uniref:protein STICHEL-like 2 n=1 Tax=Tarenaya hassleriana TaxID=28532 RepID=UPI00053C49F8|nr:PREDICTED: protein STICHEL-like 2 [Tarenaya hassleriana]
MGEVRRHSVDVPITRTLVALRRVRSLRDPSTNSMSKFASFLDNVKWEACSTNGISLQFLSRGEDDESPSGRGIENVASASEAEQFLGVKASRSPSGRCPDDLTGRGRELVCVSSPVEDDVDSSRSEAREDIYRNRCPKRSNGLVGDFASRVGSPMNHNVSMDEDLDMVDQCNRGGCGITYCWSRTPRFKGSENSSNAEDYPLLSGNTDESPLFRNKLRKRGSNELTPCLEMPRSLSQKFRPKSFDELVGQEVVVKCLLSSIFRGRITSVYLFHGPRGTGKTSACRIFAAALNCISPSDHSRPCGSCRECDLFFLGRSRDMKEMDSVKLNRPDHLRSLIKSLHRPPVSSRFKIFVIDECQILCQETWATLFNSLDGFSRHVIFILVTSELEKLPRNVVSRSQKYHFPKVKDADISNKLEKICLEEGIDFDKAALDFVASKSDGSLRDAEIMLDQLSLLSKRITTSSAYELIGVVSDDELLDLLDLALSSDTSNTVIRARELMRSKIDPMHLISQLANLIMDILAENCPESSSETRQRFLARHSSEEEKQKLSHALKILSDAEKHLRASKNQTTWLTVALLQLSNSDSSSITTNDSGSCLDRQRSKDADFCCSASSEGECLKRLSLCHCEKSQTEDRIDNHEATLESAWKRVTELCCSDSLKSFLWKRGKLTSLTVEKGMAVAEMEFYAPRHVSRAEKSWKVIAESFQSVLGCKKVEIRINLGVASAPKSARTGNLLFGIFSCSRRIPQNQSPSGSSDCEYSDCASEKTSKALRSSEGNVLSFGRTTYTHMDGHQDMAESKHGERDGSEVLRWRTPQRKGRGETLQNTRSRLIGRVLPCSAAT